MPMSEMLLSVLVMHKLAGFFICKDDRMKYEKVAKTNLELIEQWENRGLIVDNRDRAERYLNNISYYRLSAYAIPFRKHNSEEFKQDIKFNDILDLYIFDRELRLLVMDAIERIEVAIRSQISNQMSLEKQDPFWYTNEEYFSSDYNFYCLLAKIEKQLSDEKLRLKRDEDEIQIKYKANEIKKQNSLDRIRKENFLRHYITQYDSPKLPPSWMMMEMLTWGDLSHLYSGLDTKYQKNIATQFDVKQPVFGSWLKVLNDVRNICAHHGRLWNKQFGRKIKIPKSNHTLWLKSPIKLNNTEIDAEKRLYVILVAVQVLLYKISPNSTWAKRLKTLLENYPNISKEYMGIPLDWYQDHFWEKALQDSKGM